MIGIEGLGFGYGREELYRDFSLRLAEPGLYGLFGRNGSGKSTLLKLMSGLLFPRRGHIRIGGHEPQRRAAGFLAGLYFVPEEFHLPDLSCRRLARLQAGFYPRFSQQVFDEALETFELDPLQAFERMSLGGKKKAVIAFALATLTPVLLLDEPTNGMDIVARDQFRALLRRPEQAGRIVLISTHQAHDLEQVISRVLFVDQGRLALSAGMDALARALRMGVADAAAIEGLGRVLYREGIGAQTAYIAARRDGEAIEPVQLELLYRGLCREPEGILAALPPGEAGHV